MTLARTLLFFFCISIGTSLSAENFSLLKQEEPSYKLHIHNQVLAVVNNEAITILDVVKQMDMVFVRQFPEYVESDAARYQFYNHHWKNFLGELINKELVLADADEKGLKVTKGDVRQEIELMFGPNTIATLDEAGLSMDEAWKIIEKDIRMRRMLIARVNIKAIKSVTPISIRQAYEEYRNNFNPNASWKYRVVSIRDEKKENSNLAAQTIYRWLNEGSKTLEDLPPNNYVGEDLPKSANISVSSTYDQSSSEISPDYAEAMATLLPGNYSQPIAQKSRRTGKTIYRIFWLEDKEEENILSFPEISPQLKNKLEQKAIEEGTATYLADLKKELAIDDHFLEELLAEKFEPFTLDKR